MLKRIWLSVLGLSMTFGIAAAAENVTAPAVTAPAMTVPAVTVVVDATKRGEPLTPLIYGQFIEHLGRCIYGGIWAEMLEDRKFWYAVGDKESPWTSVYDCNVRMNREDSFVGEQTPEAFSDGEPRWIGVAQKGLALKKGVRYTGYAWIKPTEGIERVDVHFHWGDGETDDVRRVFTQKPEIGRYTKFEFAFVSPVDTDDCKIEIAAHGRGSLFVGTASVMPDDNIQGMRRDTLALLKELDAPVYRWPGGNFVSGYDWRDGIGDRDRRPPRKNPAWTGVEHNDFGVNEFMQFCRLLKTQPYIAVNTGAGGVENAVAELQYVNGAATTPMGKLRSEHGFPKPYNVIWWGIGNEMYGDWQIGHIPVGDYIKKHNEFVDAFRREDSRVHVIGVGAVGKWDEAFLPGAAEHLDSLSEHFYTQERKDVAEHTRLAVNEIKRISDAHRRYRETMPELKGRDIRIAMDEWNYWYGPHVFGELGTRYFVKDGLGIAAGLHEFARQSDLYMMANYAQTVNVIGCIKTNKTAAQFETTGLVLKLYRHQFGTIPLATTLKTEDAAIPLDVQAALTEDGKRLTVGVVNSLAHDVTFTLDVTGVPLSSHATRFEIADPQSDPNAFNDPGTAQRIETATTVLAMPQTGELTVKPYSVTLFSIPVGNAKSRWLPPRRLR
ncbi:MAG: alpha-L-arabinofuranosidase C-terminal domain-containing protein [Thermoguttaceae bacterium]